MRAAVALTLAALALGGCGAVSKEAGYADVGRMVAERTGEKTHWDQGAPEDAEIVQRVAKLLAQDLTEQTAMQIALLNNRELQATYEELGVAQADLVQAGLLRNPSLDLGVRFPEGSSGGVNTEFSLAQDFLDLFMLPLRKRLAGEQFEQAKLRLANEVFQVISRVRSEFYILQAQQQAVELRRTVLDASQAAVEIATRQQRAGNIGDLALEAQRGEYEQAKLDLAQDELQLELQRERLTRLMGLWGRQTEWKISAKLPDIPPMEEGLEHLESRAIERRLDVASARQEVLILTHAVELAKTSRFVGTVEVGVSRSSGPEEGIRVTGPTLRLELPLFDRRQALIRRLEAQLRQGERRLQGVSVDARSEVRAARLTLLSQRWMVEQYRKAILPIRERTVAYSQQHYNAMLLGVFQLLQARQAEVEAYRHYIEAVRDYWVARVDLERAAGGSLTAASEAHSTLQTRMPPVAASAEQPQEQVP
jgi:cobalt-zinc-cadmium efflux system outer membrane protein